MKTEEERPSLLAAFARAPGARSHWVRRIGMRHAVIMGQALMARGRKELCSHVVATHRTRLWGARRGARSGRARSLVVRAVGHEAHFYGGIQGPIYVPASFWQLYGLASLLFPITAVSGLSLGIIVFAVWHGLARSLPALVLLWVCMALLWVAWVATLIAFLSTGGYFNLPIIGVLFVGLLFVPPVLALVASIAGTVAARQRVPAHV